MIGRILLATTAVGLAMSATTAFAQIEVPGAPPVTAPPIAPTAPSLRPEEAGRVLERGQSVVERPRPEYDPLGVHIGSFFLYPRLDVDEVYNDNIFATKTGPKNDFITVASPSFDLRSNFSRNELDFRAGASVGTYASHSSENYGDYFAATNGRYDISNYLAALGGLKYEHLHEERDSPNSPGNAASPVQFDAYTATMGLAQSGLRVGYAADFAFRREDYSNVGAVGGGVIDEQVRNVNDYLPSVRVSYELAPRYQAFVRAAGDIREYDNSTGGDPAVPSRNSRGYRADVGATIDLTGVTYIDVFGGYLNQSYLDNRLSSIHGIDGGARIVWNVTELTSVSLNAARTVQDFNTTAAIAQGVSVNSPGYLASTVALAVDHELFRNLLLHAEVRYENDDFIGIDRNDNRVDAGVGARYLLNRNLYLGASYTFTERTSGGTASTQAFTRNLVLIRLGSQL